MSNHIATRSSLNPEIYQGEIVVDGIVYYYIIRMKSNAFVDGTVIRNTGASIVTDIELKGKIIKEILRGF